MSLGMEKKYNMNWKEQLLSYFKDPETLVDDIYSAGGINPGGYGFISGGYGGGIYIEQYHKLLYIHGYLKGLNDANRTMCDEVMRALNQGIKERHPDVPDDKLPFLV